MAISEKEFTSVSTTIDMAAEAQAQGRLRGLLVIAVMQRDGTDELLAGSGGHTAFIVDGSSREAMPMLSGLAQMASVAMSNELLVGRKEIDE